MGGGDKEIQKFIKIKMKTGNMQLLRALKLQKTGKAEWLSLPKRKYIAYSPLKEDSHKN